MFNDDEGLLTGANPQYSSDLDAARTSIAKMAALDPQIAVFGHGGAPISSDVAAQLAALAEAEVRQSYERGLIPGATH